MKKQTFLLAALLSVFAASAVAADVPMKPFHEKLMGSTMKCETCHQSAVPTARPSDKACIGCHGTMDKIPTKPNKFEKFPHASPHYGNTVECTACHAEHKASRAICNDCHVVTFPNLK